MDCTEVAATLWLCPFQRTLRLAENEYCLTVMMSLPLVPVMLSTPLTRVTDIICRGSIASKRGHCIGRCSNRLVVHASKRHKPGEWTRPIQGSVAPFVLSPRH